MAAARRGLRRRASGPAAPDAGPDNAWHGALHGASQGRSAEGVEPRPQPVRLDAEAERRFELGLRPLP